MSEENMGDDSIVNEIDTENYHLFVYERNLGGSPSYALAYVISC